MAGARAVKSATVMSGVPISNVDKVWFPRTASPRRRRALLRSDLRVDHAVAQGQTAHRGAVPRRPPGQVFYQKNFPVGRAPAEFPRVTVRASSTGKDVHYLVGGTKPVMLWLANTGCIAMHVMATPASPAAGAGLARARHGPDERRFR